MGFYKKTYYFFYHVTKVLIHLSPTELFISAWVPTQQQGFGVYGPPIDSSALQGDTCSDKQATQKNQTARIQGDKLMVDSTCKNVRYKWIMG